jgi:hypothetical protein
MSMAQSLLSNWTISTNESLPLPSVIGNTVK